MAALQDLTGLILCRFETAHDYIQVVFSDGTILSIFNNYVLHGGSSLSVKGKQVKAVEESDNAVVIFFKGGESLLIGLNDDDYNGPEAMVLKREGNVPIVWN